MKKQKTFILNKDDIWDGDEEIIHFIEENVMPKDWVNFAPLGKNYKIIIKIETFN